MNTETQTSVTEGYPEVGPFESEEAAWDATLPPFSFVRKIERRADGWYKVYTITTTTTTTTLCLEHGIVTLMRIKGIVP